MFRIEKKGLLRRRRLVADAVLTVDDFDAIAAGLGKTPARARKTGLIAACQAKQPKTVETRWNGEVTTNTAGTGDWIVTNLDTYKKPLRDGANNINQYAVRAETFERLYERVIGETEYGPVFKAKVGGMADALELPGGLDIKAPWGERQIIEKGYLLRNGADIYGIDDKAFRFTYETSR